MEYKDTAGTQRSDRRLRSWTALYLEYTFSILLTLIDWLLIDWLLVSILLRLVIDLLVSVVWCCIQPIRYVLPYEQPCHAGWWRRPAHRDHRAFSCLRSSSSVWKINNYWILMLEEPPLCFVAVLVWPHKTKTKTPTNRKSPLVCQNAFIHFSLLFQWGS